MFETTPRNTIVGVNARDGTIPATQRIPAPNNPTFSATPIPNIPTSTTPKGAKLMKFRTALASSQYTPSMLRRFRGTTGAPLATSSVTGLPPASSLGSCATLPSA